jgi:hypothetical protein
MNDLEMLTVEKTGWGYWLHFLNASHTFIPSKMESRTYMHTLVKATVEEISLHLQTMLVHRQSGFDIMGKTKARSSTLGFKYAQQGVDLPWLS